MEGALVEFVREIPRSGPTRNGRGFLVRWRSSQDARRSENAPAGGVGADGEMTYNSHLVSQARLRSITGTAAEHPPLPVTPPSASVSGRDRFDSVIDNIVTLPTRPDT